MSTDWDNGESSRSIDGPTLTVTGITATIMPVSRSSTFTLTSTSEFAAVESSVVT